MREACWKGLGVFPWITAERGAVGEGLPCGKRVRFVPECGNTWRNGLVGQEEVFKTQLMEEVRCCLGE